MSTDQDVLTALDFEAPPVPCADPKHTSLHADGPATSLIRTHCPTCGHVGQYLVCTSGLSLIWNGTAPDHCGRPQPARRVINKLTPLWML